jgi:hypothetical protein
MRLREMARRSSLTPYEHPAEQMVRKLEEELYLVRRQLIQMAGPEAEMILFSPSNLTSQPEVWDWFKGAMGQVLELAKPRSSEKRGDRYYHGDRAVCPLCQGSAEDYYFPDNGFAFPDGLSWHLLGQRRARQCVVSKAAFDQAVYCATRSMI